jgi:hypothetical protein
MRKFYVRIVTFTLFIFLTGVNNLEAQTAIFQESFEGSFPPTGWTILNNGAGNNWTQNTSSTYSHHGTKSMQYVYNSASAADAWAITPAIAMNTNAATITFYVRARSASYAEKLKFTVGNSNTIAAQTNVLIDNNNITNTTFAKWSVDYTPSSAGSYYFGFNCYSAADQWNLYVDSITITQSVPSCSGTPTGGNSSASASYLCASGTSILTVSGTTVGAGITYQWQSSPTGTNTWSDISGATTNPYTASVSASTDYRCKVICTNGGAYSNSTTSTVIIGAVPSNDDVCNAITLVLDAATQCANTTCATSTGDPSFTSSTPNNTIWYKYTPSVTGVVDFVFTRPSSGTSYINGWLGIYTVSSGACPTLTLAQTPSNLNFDLTANTTVTNTTPSLTAGTTYYFMIDGFSGSYGEFCIKLQSPPTPPACVTNIAPANSATNISAPVATLSWNSATNATSYDIYFGTTNPPTTNVGNISTTTTPISGLGYSTTYYWYVVPKNGGSPATGCTSNITSFTTQAAPPPPSNDDCTGAINLSAYVPYSGNNYSATQSIAGEACASLTGNANDDVWFKFVALQNGTGTITFTPTGASGFDAVIIGYSGSCGALTAIGCADATAGNGVEVMTLNGLVAGQTYYMRVYDYGATIFGTFDISLSGTALPVSLSNLKAERVGSTNKLTWSTLTEQNNKGFELQRSNDGVNFSGIDFVNSKASNGNSNATLQYTYIDEKPFKGTSYYRLKQLDFDGRNTMSNVVFVKGSKVDNISISSIYPNPVIHLLNLVVTTPTTEKVNFVITDLTGKMVSQQSLQLNSGDNNVQLPVASLANGTYIIKAVCSSGCESAMSKFVKQ